MITRTIAYRTRPSDCPRLPTQIIGDSVLYATNYGEIGMHPVHQDVSWEDEPAFLVLPRGDGVCPIKEAIDAGHRYLQLAPGYYKFPDRVRISDDEWVVIESQEKHKAIFICEEGANFRPYINKLMVKGCTIDMNFPGAFYFGPTATVVWENCLFEDSAGLAPETSLANRVPFRNTEGQKHYLLRCKFVNCRYCIAGVYCAYDTRVEGCYQDVILNSQCAFGTVVSNFRGSVGAAQGYHCDLIQYHSKAWKDVLIYGVQCIGDKYQTAYFDDHPDTSFTNCVFSNILATMTEDPYPLKAQASNEFVDCLFENFGCPNQDLLLRDDWEETDRRFFANNVTMRNMRFKKVRAASGASLEKLGITVEN